MRDGSLRRLSAAPPPGPASAGGARVAVVLCAFCLASAAATAAGAAQTRPGGDDDSAPGAAAADLVIENPPSLTVGDRASVIAVVRITPAGDRPVLVTPSSEGTAVEVVRGRLLRGDADDPDAEELRFSIPIVARAPGTAVLRVHVSGWACAERCRPVEDDAEVVMRVARRPLEDRDADR